jgi:dipeptidyl aminopeptidase/acylaminoacyl peptidase
MVSALPPTPPASTLTITAAPITISDLVEMATLSSLSISPDGKWVAFRKETPSIVSNRTELAWYVVPMDGHAPARLVGNGGEGHFDMSGGLIAELPVWSPASNALYYRALINGEIQLWRAPVDGSSAQRLTADPANIRTVALRKDGGSITYTVDATRDALEKAERDFFDTGAPGDGSFELHKPASRGYFVDGKMASLKETNGWYAYGNLLSQTPAKTVAVPLPPTDRRVGTSLVSPPEEAQWKKAWEPDRSHSRLEITTSTGARIRCTAAICDDLWPVAAIRLQGRSDYLVTLRNAGQEDVLAFWQPADQSSRVLTTSDGILTGGTDMTNACTASVEAVICVEQAALVPPRLVSISVADGRKTILFDPNAALAHRVVNPVRRIAWHDRQGVEHVARLVLPTSPKPASGYPLVLTYYVCDGFLRAGTGGELPLIPLAEHGLAVLCMTRSATDPFRQNAVVDEREALRDIKAATDLLIRDGTIDRRRIGEWGYSFGGQVTEQVLLRTKLLAAAASASNILDPTAYWFMSLPGRDYPAYLRTRFKYGDPDLDHASWKRRSLTYNIDKIRVPLLLQQSEGEARASIQFWSKMSHSPVPAELWMFSNELHTKIFPRHQAVAMARNMDWFRYWLDGARDPAPAKQEQYARWDALARRWHGSARVHDRPRP